MATKKKKKRKAIELYTVWDSKGVRILTTDRLDPHIAEELGFDEFTPKDERAIQFYIERPSKKHLPILIAALEKKGIPVSIKKYSSVKSEELGWKPWDGYKYGLKDHPEMQKMGEDLIAHDEDHLHLTAARIKYVFKKGKPRPDDFGRFELAHVELAAKYAKYLGKYDFVMVTYEATWSMLHDWQRKRLVDHELQHCCFKGGPYLQDHDIEEFTRMYEKYDVKIGDSIYGDMQEQVKLALEQIEDDKKTEKDDSYWKKKQ